VGIPPVAKLIRWLGPWAPRPPTSASREELSIGPTRLRAVLYRPRRPPIAAYLVSPGLHPRGPDDPRMDRLGYVLAEAGFLVLSPFIPDHLAILASAKATDDLMLAFDHVEGLAAREDLGAPSVFSVSFGSNPAITLCGDPRYAHRVRGLYLFGGYADFARMCRFAALGEWEHGGELIRLPYDPTNPPGGSLNFVEYMGVTAPEQEQLARAWRMMCVRTWNRDELKHVDALRPIALRLAGEELPASLRPLFLQGCGVAPGTREMLLPALAASVPHRVYANPGPSMARIRAPAVIAHGRSDTVVCFHEAAQLRAMLPANHPHRYFVTGMFGHGRSKLPSPRSVATELHTLWNVAHAMAALPLGKLRYTGA
jgi:hypothetical protein